MLIEIPDEILAGPEYGKQHFLTDIAVMLYQQERISLAKAAHISGHNRLEFQSILADRQISILYDLGADIESLKKLNKGL
ncbi:MAG: UPF0175 family protein [Bacteroidia bacterium]